MKVEFKCPFGEMSFDMSESHVASLIQQAVKYAVEAIMPPRGEASVSDSEKPAPLITPKSQNDPIIETTTGLNTKYTGFLYIRCESCGQEKGFCAKVPTSYHKCSCGHSTLLKNLRYARAICKCGQDSTYRTNIKDQYFSLDCIGCGAPVDLELTGNWTSFGTMINKSDLE